MKGTVKVWKFPDYDFEVLRTVELPHVRLQQIGPSGGVPIRYAIGSRVVDAKGRFGVDPEYDSAWLFRMEVCHAQVHLITADWYEVTGVITEWREWDDPAVALEGARRVPQGGSDFDGNVMVDHYIPPTAGPGKGLVGKSVTVRVGEG